MLDNKNHAPMRVYKNVTPTCKNDIPTHTTKMMLQRATTKMMFKFTNSNSCYNNVCRCCYYRPLSPAVVYRRCLLTDRVTAIIDTKDTFGISLVALQILRIDFILIIVLSNFYLFFSLRGNSSYKSVELP